MITSKEEDYIKNNAYVPEHITGYVTAVSGKEPFLVKDYICYFGEGRLIFVGYPLKKPFREKEMRGVLDSIVKKFKPQEIALISPSTEMTQKKCLRRDTDNYYRLDILNLQVNKKLRNMINRASKELYIDEGDRLGDEHVNLISDFMNSHDIDEHAKFIFKEIPEYLSSVSTARVFSARGKSGRLVAFDIAEFGARDCAFYMFNFKSEKYSVPGASDLLLYKVIQNAIEEKKLYINLGLGINEGVIFFKKKWGGFPFLRYEFCLYHMDKLNGLESLFRKL
jgi:hypothetical protein